jgi:hypothetical protein
MVDSRSPVIRLLSHLSPPFASYTVAFTRVVNLGLDGKFSWESALEVVTWAVLSFVISCCWRLLTDQKLLATADKPHSAWTKCLYVTEIIGSFLVFVLTIEIAAKGPGLYVGKWPAYIMYGVYIGILGYFLVGYAAKTANRGPRQIVADSGL